jgi:3-dehydroquinate synthase
MRTVKVSLGDRSYNIHIGPDLLTSIGKGCRKLGLGQRCAIITDSSVAPLHAVPVTESLRAEGFDVTLIRIPSGETSKSLRIADTCFKQLAAHRIERHSFIVALGGGVVGDLAGFVAATYLRGIPFVQIPTTLLAQVDSSVGGKVGINLKAGKNLVGAFHQPRWVVCDINTLKTLPLREYRAGLAEVIKYGIIADARLFARLEKEMKLLLERDPQTLSDIIARSCAIKADVVANDETESGRRAILNFGHTIGHALEAISKYGKYLHGEAISIGQVAAAHISHLCSGLPESHAIRIRELFRSADLPTTVDLTSKQSGAVFNAMSLDKKVQQGNVRFVLADKIGHATWGHSVPKATIEESLSLCRSH